jgi:hypothetical protein
MLQPDLKLRLTAKEVLGKFLVVQILFSRALHGTVHQMFSVTGSNTFSKTCVESNMNIIQSYNCINLHSWVAWHDI